jgi:tetratricopeptide (TPR) repeat protein
MPKRPRQHQLEDLSITALRAAIPPNWVYREKAKDYGIDGEIEIFDSQGQTTGTLFYVQLKATDAKPSTRALKIQIPIDTHTYYLNLPVPVLLVRYLSQTNALYCRWAHSEVPDSQNKNSSFSFSADNLWDGETPDTIVRDLEEFHNIRSPGLQFPITLGIQIESDMVSGIPTGLADARIRAAAAKTPHLVTLRPQQDPDPNWQITIKNSAITAILGGIPSGTATAETEGADASAIGQDVFCVLGLGLALLGHIDRSAQLLAEFAPQSTVIRSKTAGVIILGILLQSEQFSAARAIFKEYVARSSYLPIASLAVSRLLVMTHSKRSLDEARSLALLVLEAGLQRNIPDLAAVMHYNLGNSYRKSGGHQESIHHYNQARKFNSDYCRREYYLSEFAGVLFESKRYNMSRRLYKEAVEHSQGELVLALYADALMFSGWYDEAKTWFDKYLADKPYDPTQELCSERDEWHLKYHMMIHIVNSMGIKQQERNAKAATGHISRGIEEPALMHDALTRALEADALCGLAWFNMGQELVHTDNDRKAAVYSYLFAGLTQPRDVEAWVNATFLGIEQQAFDVIQSIICVAYSRNRDTYIEEVVRFVERQAMAADAKTHLINSFVGLCNRIPKEQKPAKIRLFESSEGSTMHEIVIE